MQVLAEELRKERAHNIAEVIHQSRCTLVVLQEIGTGKGFIGLPDVCKLLDGREGRDGLWKCTKVDPEVHGEHAMLYREDVLAKVLRCKEEMSPVLDPSGLYNRDLTLHLAGSPFQVAYDWKSIRDRTDYKFYKKSDAVKPEPAKAARLPAFFMVHNGQPVDSSSFRSVAVCSVHFASNKSPDTREQQIKNIWSLLPGPRYDPSRCLFVLMGDFNSDVDDFECSQQAETALKKIKEKADIAAAEFPSHWKFCAHTQTGTMLTPTGKGKRYDEILVHVTHDQSMDQRAHVFPNRSLVTLEVMYAALPLHIQEHISQLSSSRAREVEIFEKFQNYVLSDHQALYVDLEFSADAVASDDSDHEGAHIGGGKAADPSGITTPATTKKQNERMPGQAVEDIQKELFPSIKCKHCLAGKGCQYAGKEGHLAPK
jgi:endonuclease/exonuclease/phosphatase family metal-dependent hydrolase